MQKAFVIVATLAGFSCPATAAYIPAGDSILFYGNAYFEYSEQTIEFLRGQTLPPYESPGSPFAQLGPNLGFIWQNEFTDLPITQIGNGSDLWCGANCLVTIGQYDGPLGAWLNVLDMHVAVNQPDSLIVGGAGIFTMTGYDPTPGNWMLFSNWIDDPRAPTGWWQGVGFISSGPPAQVPGPLAGAGLPGLAAGGALLLWLGRRRRAGDPRATIPIHRAAQTTCVAYRR
jgi:hypothetical protein